MFDKLVGPARWVNLKEIYDESTLETQVNIDKMLKSTIRPGNTVQYLDLVFTSQQWHETLWKHRARIYIPVPYQKKGNVGIIGTHMDFCPEREYTVGGRDMAHLPQFNRSKILGPNNQPMELGTEREFCEATAIDLGLPIMLFHTPGARILDLDESDLMGYALTKLMETGDMTWYPYLPIAVSYLRAITLLHSFSEIQAERAVLLGNSKRGVGVYVATGIDPDRIAGVLGTGYFGGNWLYNLLLKYAQLGPGVGGSSVTRAGPGFQPADRLFDRFNSPIGFLQLMAFDPYYWRDQIKSTYIVAIGTNDEFFGLGAPNPMMQAGEGEKGLLYIDNLAHTWTSYKHLTAWRMLLGHVIYNRPIPQVEVTTKGHDARLQVHATVSKASELKNVKLYYAFNKSSDWRFATWESLPMKADQDHYQAILPLQPDLRLAYYVEVEDSHVRGGLGYISSLMFFED